MKWINMTERMPPEGVKVRTFDKNGKIRYMTLTEKDGELVFMPDGLRPIYDTVWWMWKEDE